MQNTLQPIILQMTKAFTKANINYSQSQEIIKQVRKNLGLKPSKKKTGTVKRLSRNEYQRFINASYEKSPLVGLMMQTLFETACRVDEFVNLQADDIYFEELKMVVRSGKGDKRREVPIELHLSRQLAGHLDTRKTGPIFRNRKGKPFSARRIQQIVKELAASAEIHSIEVTPHTLRHTRATFLAEDGMSKDALQVFLGHELGETTEIYTHTAAIDVGRAFRGAVAVGQN